jgi:hypothetical protein
LKSRVKEAVLVLEHCRYKIGLLSAHFSSLGVTLLITS